VDILTAFENGDRLVGIGCNDDGVSGFFEFFRDEFPDQGLIFDNQDVGISTLPVGTSRPRLHGSSPAPNSRSFRRIAGRAVARSSSLQTGINSVSGSEAPSMPILQYSGVSLAVLRGAEYRFRNGLDMRGTDGIRQ
jgi:hypothetical protein